MFKLDDFFSIDNSSPVEESPESSPSTRKRNKKSIVSSKAVSKEDSTFTFATPVEVSTPTKSSKLQAYSRLLVL